MVRRGSGVEKSKQLKNVNNLLHHTTISEKKTIEVL
jgi:hypothetical protein